MNKPRFHFATLKAELVCISVTDPSGLLRSIVQRVFQMRRGLFLLQDNPQLAMSSSVCTRLDTSPGAN